MSFTRETVRIPSVEANVNLDVWFYKPNGPGPFPVIIAGHGTCVIKEAGYATFGEAWAVEAGWASLILDYRRFGDSDGEPRNLLVLEHQLQDYKSVLKWARQRPELFKLDKIVVAGISLAGLYVADLVSTDAGLAGGIGICPNLDGYATATYRAPNLTLSFWACVDYIRGRLGLSPYFVKLAGSPQEFAFLNTPSTLPGYQGVYGRGSKPFSPEYNTIAPRFAFDIMASRPGLRLKDALCPMLVVMAEDDDLVPPSTIKNVCLKANEKVKLVSTPGGHFDLLSPGHESYKINLHAQLDFLQELL